MKFYQSLAVSFQAYLNCVNSKSKPWEDRHRATIESLVKEHMPSGSGFDSGTTFDFVASKSELLVFNTSFHHMDEHGYYCGWTSHSVIVTPSLCFGFDLRITGRDRNDIKDYIGEVFNAALHTELETKESV